MTTVQKHEETHSCPFRDIVIPTAQQTPTSSDPRMDTRVGRLEGVVETLTKDVQEVSRSVGELGKNMTIMRDGIDANLVKLRDTFTAQLDQAVSNLTHQSKPQWQSIFAFVCMGLTVLGMAGAVVGMMFSGIANNIGDLKTKQEIITERLFAAEREKGRSDARNDNVVATMQLMTNAAEAKIKSLDDRSTSELNNLRADIDNICKWRLEHAAQDAADGAKMEARQIANISRIDALEHHQWEDRNNRLMRLEDINAAKSVRLPSK